MALRGAIAVGRCQCCWHRRIILAEALGKALQLPPGAGKDPFEPGLQPLRGPLAHHPRKGLRMGGQCREERIGLLDLEQLGLLGLSPLVRTAEQAIRHLASGQCWGCRSRRGLWPTFAPSLARTPGGQHTRHAPVPPTEALSAHLVPELRRTVLPGLPALPQIRPIPCETTAIAGATFPFRETLLREPVAQGARRHPDLLGDNRPRVAVVPERPGALVLGQALSPPGRPGGVGAGCSGPLRCRQGVGCVGRLWDWRDGRGWWKARRLREGWRPWQDRALA